MTETAVQKKEQGFLTMLKDPRMLEQVQVMCPGFLDPVQLFRVATTQFRTTPKLQACTPTSLMSALFDCAASGLLPDGRYAHMVPYGDTAVFIPDWKGLVMLGMKSEGLRRWRTDIVCKNDIFQHNKGRIVEHTWDVSKERGDVVGYYSEVVYPNGEEDFEFMTEAEVKVVQSRSPAGRSGPWVTDAREMGRKTPLKRLAKRLGHVLTREFEEAITRDADRFAEVDVTDDVEAVAATDKLKDIKAQAEGGLTDASPPPRQRKPRSDKGKSRKPVESPLGPQDEDAPNPPAPSSVSPAPPEPPADAEIRQDLLTEIEDYMSTVANDSDKKEFLSGWTTVPGAVSTLPTDALQEIAQAVRRMQE